MAWRNLGRNRRRTAITSTALAIGVALSIGAYGWMDGMIDQLLHSLTRFDLGHVQLHHPDFPRTRSSEHALRAPDELIAEAENIDDVLGVAPRVYSFALLSHEGKSLGVSLVGVDPAREPKVTVLHSRVQGQYLDLKPTTWPRGRALTESERERDQAITERAEADAMSELEELEGLGKLEVPEPDNGSNDQLDPEGDSPEPSIGVGMDARSHDSVVDHELTREFALAQSPPPERPPRVLIGAALARILKLEVGDQVHATGQTVDGQTEEVFFEIAGIFRTGTAQFDRTRMLIHIADLQRYMHLYDQVHEIALVTKDAQRAGQVVNELRHRVAEHNGQPILVRAWDEIRPDIKRMVDLSQSQSAVLVFIIFFVAILGVVNTMLMAVFERTREFGVLKAIGLSSLRVVALVVTETLYMVLLAAVIGTALGLGLDLYMIEYGIDLSSFTEGFSIGGVGIDPVMHGVITWRGVLVPVVILSIMSFLASLYPAIRAARLQPAVGMREI